MLELTEVEFFEKIKSLHKEELKEEDKRILVHCCCAVCFGYPSQLLRMLGYIPTAYFFNPNIYPKNEYDRRLEELRSYCKKYDFELIEEDIEGDLSPKYFYNNIKGLEEEPEKGLRCNKCFELRLMQTAKKAKELGFKKFTTTLTVSPHKVSENIFAEAFKAAKTEGVEFARFDFKKNNGFNITQKIANFNNMYKQTYCGCEFSIKKPKEDKNETETPAKTDNLDNQTAES